MNFRRFLWRAACVLVIVWCLIVLMGSGLAIFWGPAP